MTKRNVMHDAVRYALCLSTGALALNMETISPTYVEAVDLQSLRRDNFYMIDDLDSVPASSPPMQAYPLDVVVHEGGFDPETDACKGCKSCVNPP